LFLGANGLRIKKKTGGSTIAGTKKPCQGDGECLEKRTEVGSFAQPGGRDKGKKESSIRKRLNNCSVSTYYVAAVEWVKERLLRGTLPGGEGRMA